MIRLYHNELIQWSLSASPLTSQMHVGTLLSTSIQYLIVIADLMGAVSGYDR